MYACLAVTCHLHFWQYDRDFLRATVVTRGWNGYRSKSQHRKSTLEKKILPPFQQGFEPATFQSQVRRSNHWAIPAPYPHIHADIRWCLRTGIVTRTRCCRWRCHGHILGCKWKDRHTVEYIRPHDLDSPSCNERLLLTSYRKWNTAWAPANVLLQVLQGSC